MRRLYLFVCIGLLCSAAGFALIFLINGSTQWYGSDPLSSEPEQQKEIITVSSPTLTPSPIITSTSKRLTSIPTTPAPVTYTLSSASPYSISTIALEQRVHELINQQRTGKCLGALSFDTVLADIARKHSEDMATIGYFAHDNPAGQDPTARGIAAGYICRKNYSSYYTYGIAENLFQNNLCASATYFSNRDTVYDWNSPEEIAQITVAGWMNSSGHRENILTRTFNREGIGIAIASDGKVYITEDFC